MSTSYSISLSAVVKEHKLEILHKSSKYETQVIDVPDVNRPALQLSGFYDYFNPQKMQAIGMVETEYLKTLSAEERLYRIEELFKNDVPAIILCHQATIFPEYLDLADKYDRNVFVTEKDTSDFLAACIISLHNHLAPRLTLHGVLVEVHGEGILIMGDSGVGKSETALELIKRGHKFIADDAVEIRRMSDDSLVGKAPALIRDYMELRGIGVVNVRKLYGVGAIKKASEIELIVKLEPWDEKKPYDRLGLSNETEDVLGVTVPAITIPVRPGRNLAVILELAAMNNRQKALGFNDAEALADSVDNAIESGNF